MCGVVGWLSPIPPGEETFCPSSVISLLPGMGEVCFIILSSIISLLPSMGEVFLDFHLHRVLPDIISLLPSMGEVFRAFHLHRLLPGMGEVS